MNLDEASLIIGQNAVVSAHYSDSSFVGRLHEESVWDHVLFHEWSEAISWFIAREATREIREMAFDTYAYIVGVALLSHINPGDGYRITNIDIDKLYEIKDEVDLLFDRFLGSRRFSPP